MGVVKIDNQIAYKSKNKMTRGKKKKADCEKQLKITECG